MERSAVDRANWVLVVVAIALRTWAYVADVSLSLDEMLLSRNILGRPLVDLLTKPLELDQVAPRGFLLVEKLAVLAFGRRELVLRLFPFLCSIASVFLFRRLANRVLGGWGAVFALAVFALAIPFIQFGVEVKQYILDATASVVLLSAAIALREPNVSSRQLVLAGVLGWVVIWFSQASVIVMGGLGLAFTILWLLDRSRGNARIVQITVPLWATASLAAVLMGLKSMTPSTREFMDDFWQTGFLPLPVALASSVQWVWRQFESMFSDPTLLFYPWSLMFMALAVVGIVALWRRDRGAALLLIGPGVVAIVAAVAQQYPLRGRLMFYLIPGVLLALGSGAEAVRAWSSRFNIALGYASLAVLAAPAVVAMGQHLPPYDIEHHRTFYAYLAQNRRPGDIIHVFPLSRVGALYYGPQYGIQPSDVTTAMCDRDNTRTYIRDVDRYRGANRVWLLTSGSRPFRVARASVRKYLSTIGVKRDSLIVESLTGGSASLELYDLSDPQRLGAADAESFPVSPMPRDPRPGCRPFVRPSPLDSLR